MKPCGKGGPGPIGDPPHAPLCLIKDAAGHVGRITSRGPSLAGGRSHTIICTKTSTSVTAAADDLTPEPGWPPAGWGPCPTPRDLFIGAKNKAYGDGFAGSISAITLY